MSLLNWSADLLSFSVASGGDSSIWLVRKGPECAVEPNDYYYYCYFFIAIICTNNSRKKDKVKRRPAIVTNCSANWRKDLEITFTLEVLIHIRINHQVKMARITKKIESPPSNESFFI